MLKTAADIFRRKAAGAKVSNNAFAAGAITVFSGFCQQWHEKRSYA